MLISRSRRVVIAWIAMLAIQVAAFAPAISHAIGSTLPPSWAAICSSVGTKQFAANADSSQTSGVPGAGHQLEHCPYCSLHTDAGLMPRHDSALPLPPLLAESLPPHFLRADKTHSLWSSAQPRAPPVLG
jgi:hypothetical protein